MTGLFGTLNTGTKGLHASQIGLQTTGHNLSNLNTAGYSRQRVTQEADTPMTFAGIGQVGTGVLTSSINRVTDDYLINQVQKEHSVLKTYEQKSDLLGKLEAIYNEPSDSGLSGQMNKVFAAWTNLGSQPELETSKTMVVQQTHSFTDTLHHMGRQMDELLEEGQSLLEKDARDFNSTIEQLDTLNKQIFNVVAKGHTPNDLLDQRDRLLGKLSDTVGVEKSIDSYSRVSITLGGETILNAKERNTLSVSNGLPPYDAGTDATFYVETEGGRKDVVPISGTARGTQDALAVVANKKTELNDFAYNFARAVNTIHQGEADSGGIPFFSIEKENAAATISVHEAIQNNHGLIQAGKESNSTSAQGDGTRAQAIAKLKHTKLPWVAADGTEIEWTYDKTKMEITSSKSGYTLGDSYINSVTDMGILKEQSDNMASMQDNLTGLLKERHESMSGVDMNEEVVDMIRYQSAFQANSRVISAISEMLDTLINRTGV